MKRLAASALMLMSVCWSIHAQMSIRGTVSDAETGGALAGAHLKVLETGQQAVSAENGQFHFDNLPGPVTLEVSYVGYRLEHWPVDPQQSAEAHITLTTQMVMEEVVIQGVRAGSSQPTTQKTLQRAELQKEYWGQDAVLNLERVVPSVLAHSEAGSNFANYSLMRLRGIDQSRINITVNGVPLNDMVDQGVFFSNITDFTNSIESVQVQRGVGTSTNGTASYAGSINYETIRLNEPGSRGDVQLTLGSFGSVRASAAWSSGRLVEKWAFSTRFTKTLSDGYKFNSGTNSHSMFFSGGYFGEKDLLKLTILAGRTRNELAYLPVSLQAIRQEPRTNWLDPGDKDDFHQELVQLQHSHAFNSQWSLTSSVYYGSAAGDFPFGFDIGDGTILRLNFPLQNEHWGLMSNLGGETSSGWRLNLGIHAYVFTRNNQEQVLPDKDSPYYSDRSEKDEVSLFGKISRQWGPWNLYGDLQLRRVALELQPDLQFLSDQGVATAGLSVPVRHWTFLNPKLGLRYQLIKSLDLFVSLGRSGREPTRADILGSTMINAFNLEAVMDEKSVRAEYVNDLELGANLTAEKFKGQINFFFMDFTDEIAPTGDFIAEGFVQLRQNIRDSYRTGVEADWLWSPDDRWSLGGQATFMRSRIREFTPGGSTETYEDVEPILSPHWIVNARSGYQITDWLQLGLSGRFVSESFLELTNRMDLTMPDFLVLNTQANIQWKDFELVLRLNNIFDKQYFTNGAPLDLDFDGIHDAPGYLVQAPRHFFGTLRFNF